MKRFSNNSDQRLRSRLRVEPSAGRYRYVRKRWHVLFAVIDALGELLMRGAEFLARRKTAGSEQPAADPRSILLVQFDHLGDAILTTAILPALRNRYPKAVIDVLAAPWNKEVFAACAEVDRVHVSRVNRFGRGMRLGWLLAMIWWGLKLRRERYDLAIDIRGEFPLALLLWLTGAKQRLGWACGGGGFILTHSAQYVAGRHEVESRWALLTAIGIKAPERDQRTGPRVVPSEAARTRIRWQLPPRSASSQRLFVFHIGAGTAAKRWPVEHWRTLLGQIVVELGGRVMLVGGPGECELAQKITEGLPWPGVLDWTGRLNLNEFAATLERADLFVGADSGPAHLAAAVGIPTVVLFSGTNYSQQWKPWGKRVVVVRHEVACSPCHRSKCPLADHPCLSELMPQTVLNQINAMLEPTSSETFAPTLPIVERSLV